MYQPPPGKHIFKIRIADSGEDYIEIEMDDYTLSYRTLMERCCLELNVHSMQVEKIRKMPDTRIRGDEDIGRLNAFETFEIVLGRDK